MIPAGASAAGPLKPAAIQPGDTIAIVGPAGPRQENHVAFIEERLRALGYHVLTSPQVTTRWGYLAGTDEERAASVMEAWRNPEVDAIFCSVGGYGTTRMIDQLDFDYIRENPKILTGFSDITGIHLAIHERTGLVTFHSPTTMWVYGRDEAERPFAVESFWRAVDAESYPAGEDAGPGWTLPLREPSVPIETINPGKATGRLTGGNLSLIHALMGTEFEIQTEGRILFLEDVGEAPYRVDRMLSTLRLSGKLDNVAGVVLGQWSRCEASNPDRSFTLREVLDHYFEGRDYPVVFNFPVGHVNENATLPLGILAELDADAGTLRLLEDPVALPSG